MRTYYLHEKGRCKFCEFIEQSDAQRDFFNKSLLETENFLVIPSLGSYVQGWLLILPKSHVINIGALPMSQYDEFAGLLSAVKRIMQANYNGYTIFEHGPAYKGSTVGCGVDHAHMHIVPIDFEYQQSCHDAGLSKINNIDEDDFRTQKRLSNSRIPYLYIKRKNTKSEFYTGEEIPSQFFRKIMAKEVDKEFFYDYKKHFFLENVEETVKQLKPYFNSLFSDVSYG